MKKYRILFLLTLSASFVFFSCEKKDDEQQEEPSKTLVKFMFNGESDLDDWSFYSNDDSEMLLDKENKTEGASSLFLKGACCSIINETGYSVKKNTNYKITLDIRYEELEEGSHCGGAYNLALVIIQGDDSEWFSLIKQ
jgi:hypothetical protein